MCSVILTAPAAVSAYGHPCEPEGIIVRKQIAAVGLAALMTVGAAAQASAQQQQPGTATQAPSSQQVNQGQARDDDNDFPWGLLGLLGLGGLAGLKRREQAVRRDDRVATARHD
jgi:MYXO-CTERM domain-containing protein